MSAAHQRCFVSISKGRAATLLVFLACRPIGSAGMGQMRPSKLPPTVNSNVCHLAHLLCHVVEIKVAGKGPACEYMQDVVILLPTGPVQHC